MQKIQTIHFNDYIQLEKLSPMYCRSAEPIFTVEDGSARLGQGQFFDFLTWFNSLFVSKWKEYTCVDTFYLVLDLVGKFNIDLMGHLSEENGFQKEWGGRFSYDIQERREIVIQIPKTMQSNVISFGLYAHEDTYVYNAYYAADIPDNSVKKPFLSVYTDLTNGIGNIKNNLVLFKEKVLKNATYANNFRWIVYDPKSVLGFECDDNIEIVNNHSKALQEIKEGTHVVIADSEATLSADSFYRLYDLLSLIKDEYRGNKIGGTIFRKEEADKAVNISFQSNGKDGHNITASMPVYNYINLGIWNATITDGELIMPTESKNIFIPCMFYAIPSNQFEPKSIMMSADEKNKGYSLLINKEDVIMLNGICAWIPSIRYRIESSPNNSITEKQIYKLQELLIPGQVEIEVTRNMYYRSSGKITIDPKGYLRFMNNNYYDFFTYFNAFSLEKWKKYTAVNNIYLMIEACGKFSINLMGHYKSKIGYQKEWLGDYSYELYEKETIIIPYPRGLQSSLISFGLDATDRVKIYSIAYVTDIEQEIVKKPLISMVTTTFKKESFIARNMELMTDQLLKDPDYRDSFCWYIIDNGRSVVPPVDMDERITIVPNNNVGGAGGFARGQIESLKRDEKPTHILFMDDDVVFIPDSFKRLCRFLSIIKDEYKDHFISGAMLKIGQPNVQHENTGWLNDLGNNESLKTNYDLNLWNVIIDNEEINDSIPNRFAAFWFCCVPTTIATMNNLPLPVFFRGDDIEYSLRNKAKIITLNGLCIWHEGFEGRFSASLDFYLTVRNKLMLCAINPHLNHIDMIGNIEENFWEEMRKYDYKGAAFFLDAIEDFMKGPDFYRNTNGEAKMKEKKAADNKLSPINPEIRGKIDYPNLYFAEPLNEKDSEKYELTYNCQDAYENKSGHNYSSKKSGGKKPEYSQNVKGKTYKKKDIGVIPYGWGTWPSKVYKKDEVIAVDAANDTYVVYKKSEEEFQKLKERFEKLMTDYEEHGTEIIKAYQESQDELSGETFWNNYLK